MQKYIIIIIYIIIATANQTKAQWSEVGGLNSGSFNNGSTSLCSDGHGNIYIATGILAVAKFNGSNWSTLTDTSAQPDLNGQIGVLQICSDPSGNIYAIGEFYNANYHHFVDKFDGNTWSELGGTDSLASGFHYNSPIAAICSDGAGNIYAGGSFTDANGNNFVAKFDGSRWSHLLMTGPVFSGAVTTMCCDPSGNLYVAGGQKNPSTGNYIVSCWNGTQWTVVSNADDSLFSGGISYLCSDLNGNIYAEAYSNTVGVNIAEYSGGPWNNIPIPGNGNIFSFITGQIICDKHGNLYAYGITTGVLPHGRNVLIYNGSGWSETFSGILPYYSFASLQTYVDGNDYVYVGGGNLTTNGPYYVLKSDFPAGIGPVLNDAAVISMYPNPTSDFVTIRSTKSMQTIKVLNQEGAVILTRDNLNSDNYTLPVGSLAAGIYFVQVIGQGGNCFKKIIVP